MNNKDFTFGRKVKFTAIIILFFLIILTLIGEVFARIFVNDNQEYSEKSILDKQLGWKPKENYTSTYNMSTHGDDPLSYNVKYETFKNGFRIWGNVNSSKPKIFFIGDSYVQAVEVSNDKTFFSHIGDSLNVEVFAFGQAGYGTLQEMMILKKYMDEIQPDIIVLQTCDNDFVDNYAPLEYNSTYKVGLKRPYYNGEGEVVYRKPVKRWKEMIDKSKFLGLIRKKLENTFRSEKNKTAQELIFELNEKYEPYLRSQEITKNILIEMKQMAGNIPIISFSASPYEPQLSDMKRITEESGIPFFDNIGKEIQKLSWHKKKVYSRDGYHWSEVGHLKVSKMLIANLKEIGLVDVLNSN